MGLYLAFSGILGEDVAYSEHKALRPHVEPKGLAVLGIFFLTLVLVGAFKPKLLLLHLVIWLALALIFGFFTSDSLAGLNLSKRQRRRSWTIPMPPRSKSIERHHRLRKASRRCIGTRHLPWETATPHLFETHPCSCCPEHRRRPGREAVPAAVHRHRRRTHSRLRSATGDVYMDGEWLQLEPISLDSETWDDLPRKILDMIHQGVLDEALIEQGLDALASAERSLPDLLAQPVGYTRLTGDRPH